MPLDDSPLPSSLAGAPPQQWIAAPSPAYLTGEESLRVSSLANLAGVTLTITGRILRPDNTISRINVTHTPNGTRTIATTIVALSEGWLLGLTVRATAGAPSFGQVWALLELGNGLGGAFAVDQTLGCGFVTANIPLPIPAGVNMLATDGPGALRVVSGTTPALGGEVLETVPTGARWELLSVSVQLVTNFAGANRFPTLFLDDGVTRYFSNMCSIALTPSQTRNVSWSSGVARYAEASSGQPGNSLPVGVQMAGGHRLGTSTLNIDGNDQYSNVRLLVREWFDS